MADEILKAVPAEDLPPIIVPKVPVEQKTPEYKIYTPKSPEYHPNWNNNKYTPKSPEYKIYTPRTPEYHPNWNNNKYTPKTPEYPQNWNNHKYNKKDMLTKLLQIYLKDKEATPQSLLVTKQYLKAGANASAVVDHIQDPILKQMVLAYATNKEPKKNLDGIPKMYIPFGHGYESNKRVLVPPGNMFISFNKCGLLTYTFNNMYFKIIEAIQKVPKAFEYFRKPIGNKKNIAKLLNVKEETIYIKAPPKDTLPDISYTLLAFWNYKDDNMSMYSLSGLVPLEAEMDPIDIKFLTFRHNKDDGIKFFTETFPELFKYSIKPSYEEVKAAFGTVEAIKDTLKMKDLDWKKVTEEIPLLPMFKVTIHELMKEFPGIYYHTLCRGPYEEENNISNSIFPPLRQLSEENASGGKRKTKKRSMKKRSTRKHKKN